MIFGGSLLSTSWTHILFIHHDDLSVYWSTSQYKSELVGLLMSLAIDITYILFSLQLDYGCSSKREEQTKHNTELKMSKIEYSYVAYTNTRDKDMEDKIMNVKQ